MTDVRMRFPEGKQKALTLSYDDGVEQDVRLIEIMQKNGLKGTFNLNSGRYPAQPVPREPGKVHRRMTKESATSLYGGSGMEVAVHGLSHCFMDRLPSNLCLEEIVQDRKNLEEQFGTIVRGMAYPYGTFSDDLVQMLRYAGIAYARTTVSTEKFDVPKDWLRWNPTCHHKNSRLMELARDFAENRRRNFRNPWLFYLWGHSYEFEQDDNWPVIEEFASYMAGRPDIWYATNLEICDYVENWYRLIFSMDGSRVFNPTCCDLYLNTGEETLCVPPGQQLTL